MDKTNCSLMLVNPPVSDEPWPPFLEIMTQGLSKDQYFSWPLEHLGLMSIKSTAESAGMEVSVIDGIVEQHSSTEQTWQAIVNCAQKQGPPAVVGFSSMIAFLQNVELAERCKRQWPGTVTIFGHDFATLNWRRILQDYDVVDIVCIGEGEKTFTTLAESVLENRGHIGISGTAWRDANGEVCSTSSKPIALDDLPWPDRSSYRLLQPLGFAPAVFSTRGCPFRCSFCTTGAVSANMRSAGYRLKSIENLVNEIEYLHREFGADFVTIVDDLFVGPGSGSRARAEAFAMALSNRRLKIQFMFDTRVDAIEKNLFKHLYSVGLRRVIIGLESGDNEQLTQFNKTYTRVPSVKSKLSILMDLGIEIVPGILAFHPSVAPHELRKTVDILDFIDYKNLKILLNRVIAYPGTPLHREYAAKGFLNEDWPVGQWTFQDPIAEEMFDRFAKNLKDRDHTSAHKYIDNCLDEWENRLSKQTHLIT